MLSHQSGSIEKYTTYRARGRMPTTSRRCESGTPIHSAIYDQPSSHCNIVIWLRDGLLFSCASENDAGRSTMPSTETRQSANPPACSRLYVSFSGGISFASGGFEIFDCGNSRASECLVNTLCEAYVSVSPGP